MDTKTLCGACKDTDYAAASGHLECLAYLHENGCEWDGRTCMYAAVNGHLECLKYAFEHGCSWDRRVCSYAAKYGHLECLEYAHANGCPWDEFTCCFAAKNGHLECLVYAHENGCPWNKWICENATGHLECLAYVHEKGFPCIHNTGKLKKYSTELDTTTDNEDIQCGICYQNRNKVEFKPCNHKLCIACSNKIIITNQSIDTQCPFCRGKVETTLLIS